MNSLFQTFVRSSRQHGSRVAVVNGDERVTYTELAERVDRFAQSLERRGVAAGSKVGLRFASEIDFVVALLAVQQLSAVACPFNFEVTDNELSELLALIDPALLIVTDQQGYEHRGNGDWRGHVISFGMVTGDSGDKPIAAAKAEEELQDVAVILCTSGTTGLPKAAMLTQQSIAVNLEAFRDHLESFDGRRWLDYEVFGNPIPLSHPYGLIMMTLMPLSLGGATVQIPKFSPRGCLEVIDRERITFFGGVPSMYAMLNRFRGKSEHDTSSCRLWISGGAPLPASVAAEFATYYGAQICEGFGMLETSSLASLNFETPLRHPGSVGPFHSRMEAEIRNEEGTRLAAGETGELWVAGPNLMKGYYRNPAATAEAIQNNWLRTGDIGYFDEDGHCYLKGRCKEMVIVGGHNVYPAEVETVLLTHPLVVDAAVAAQPDLTRGERLLGFVVTAGNEGIDASELGEYCRARLSPYKVPRAFYAVSAIPRNAAGKIVRRDLIAGLNAAVTTEVTVTAAV